MRASVFTKFDPVSAKQHPGPGWQSFDCRGVRRVEVVTRGYGHGAFLVKNAPDGPVLGRIKAESSNIWECHGADIAFPDGIQPLYLTWEGSGDLQLQSIGFGK